MSKEFPSNPPKDPPTHVVQEGKESSLYASSWLWAIGMGAACVAISGIELLFQPQPLSLVLVGSIVLLLAYGWVKSTRKAEQKTQPSPLHGSIKIRQTNVSEAERNALLRYLFSPDPRNPKKIKEEVLVMTRRDKLYLQMSIAVIILVTLFTFVVILWVMAVVENIADSSGSISSSTVKTVLILAGLGVFYLISQTDLSPGAGMMIVGVMLVAMVLSNLPSSALNFWWLAILFVALLASGLAWLEWTSWFFVCTPARAYLVRYYPPPWSWLGDKVKRLRLKTVDEVQLDNPWWARMIDTTVGNMKLNGPTDESKQFKQINWLPKAELIHSLLESAIENRERGA